ncbi:uncharacterized protein FA14DRAFT_160468 [Meira miltonrushii]|uniref:DASH complex subunit DAM1 n=1 Tax=Meira miltonrushii TaxID=1280837 RepID=A0A316VC46_9BASI|nr:uncharacterized protein FA14DRAFT_160468 [Meira miltonrushii]PWN35237.1 hypothetical protein FA14DRAFT_160468 [Meira miltonrushii]
MPPRSRPTTPVRRVSRGSISSHHRASVSGGHALGSSAATGNGPDAEPTPLSFLSQAIGDLAYETATLQSNLEAVDEIQGALHTFDESFSLFLYGLKMNAFCVEWQEAPGEENFERAEERKAAFAMDSSRRYGRPSFAGTAGRPSYAGTAGDGSTTVYDAATADQTYMTQDDDIDLGQRKPTISSAQQKVPLKPALKSAMKKPTPVSATTAKAAAAATSRPGQAGKATTSAGASTSAAPQKPKITAAEKKKREAAAEQVVDLLPLDYRGGDPSAKRLAMSVILALIAAGQKGIRINEIVRAPDLPQAKVNKCLIALVGAKQVLRRSDNGVVYHLDPEKNPIAA